MGHDTAARYTSGIGAINNTLSILNLGKNNQRYDADQVGEVTSSDAVDAVFQRRTLERKEIVSSWEQDFEEGEDMTRLRYSKTADWEYISDQVATAVDTAGDRHIPVIRNGDIFSYVDVDTRTEKHQMLSACVMIGRGALIKPWLAREIKGKRHWDISATERLDILKDVDLFVWNTLEHWGSDQEGVNKCRRYLLGVAFVSLSIRSYRTVGSSAAANESPSTITLYDGAHRTRNTHDVFLNHKIGLRYLRCCSV